MPVCVPTLLPTETFPVGITRLTLRIGNPRAPSRGFEHELIVDPGALSGTVPGPLLAEMGIEPDRSQTVELRVQRAVGGASSENEGIRSPAPVVFGKRPDAAILGAVTLEALAFDLDPPRQAIRPIKAMSL